MADAARGLGRKTPLIVALIALTAASTTAGAIAFAFPAALGATFPLTSRSMVTIAAVSGFVALALRRPGRPWQRDVETPQRWLLRKNLSVALLNGAALGVGVATRIGFWAWWLLPLFVFQLGEISIGIATGMAYGATRLGASSVMTLYASATGRDPLLSIGALRPALDAAGEALAFVGAVFLLTISAVIVATG